MRNDLQEKNISVGLLTGDNKINIEADIVIATTEIIRNSLLKTSEQNKISMEEIGCVIMDEVHFINDPNRGKVWEDTIILLDKSSILVNCEKTKTRRPSSTSVSNFSVKNASFELSFTFLASASFTSLGSQQTCLNFNNASRIKI